MSRYPEKLTLEPFNHKFEVLDYQYHVVNKGAKVVVQTIGLVSNVQNELMTMTYLANLGLVGIVHLKTEIVTFATVDVLYCIEHTFTFDIIKSVK